VLRAGPFSDERISGLINARFVPVYFDLGSNSPAADAAAREFVVKLEPKLGGRSVPTPPVLLANAAGELFGEVSNYASEQELRRVLLETLAAHPEYAQPAPAEEAAGAVERARLAMLLGDEDTARALLAHETGDEARLLLAQMARRGADWEALERHLADLSDSARALHRPLELAYRERAARRFADMQRRLDGVPRENPRYDEARYLYGLALFHQGKVAEARATWAALVAAVGESRWTYRADWAHAGAAEPDGGRRSFSATGPKTLLGRHGYMGRRNPDLDAQ
jgi:hypothetical protein